MITMSNKLNAPKDDIDWALIMYLYRHSTYSAFYKEQRNVITVGKVAKYFDLEQLVYR